MGCWYIIRIRITLDDHLLEKLKTQAAATGTTVSRLIEEEALRVTLGTGAWTCIEKPWRPDPTPLRGDLVPETPMQTALEFCDRLVAWPRSVMLCPTERHWPLFAKLCGGSRIKGALASDASLAALCIEHGCELVAADSDFARFEGLRWRHPLGVN